MVMMPRIPPEIITQVLLDGKHDVGELDLHDRGPEGAQAEPRDGWLDRATLLGASPAAEEVLVRQVQQVECAQQLDPGQRQEMDREQRREDSKEERSEDAVPERLLLLVPGQTEHQNREHERVVGAQQSLEQHQERDGDEIRSVNVHSGAMRP
jgi:hypothetical protein